ncbi:uncharacterized protein I303_103257 [Kwoniella dejecticola CBS 10117]|uniref:Uncharacterized protein n=1 Tax=Kwoniella dejecticola CBS 10117 TaxID=1296121 RepID=A0A1A6AB28_9TREE|nr:uncharacterized protein I303_03280 [Kwoniella dejecticola CBS 10117]OBR87255.1 hypothetical protein I303_03280 [Kwoniella dejecticola CBS 10117]
MRLTAPPRSTSLISLLALPLPLGVLCIAYLIAVARRPEIPESAQIEDPHQWGFPKWYGQQPSPFDFSSTSVGEDEEICDHPKSILLFIDLPYDSPLIPSALTLLHTLQTANRFNVSVISTFSPTWDGQVSIRQNLQGAGCETKDWIWRVGDNSGSSDLGCEKAIWVEEGVGKPGKANVSLLSHPHHLLGKDAGYNAMKAFHGDQWELGLLTSILPAPNSPTIFYPARRVTSRKSVVYFPSRTTSPKDYPRLPWGRIWSIYSPSRRSPPKIRASEDPFSDKSAWKKFWVKEEQKLASTMRDAGVCLFEGWQNGQLDDRIAKAMLSGCIVATVPPKAHHDAFLPLILPLSRPDSVALQPKLPVHDLNHVLSTYTNPQLQRLALKAFMTARNRLVPMSRLKGVEGAVKVWEEGGRGYEFKDGFRWDCEAGEGGWCS